MIDLFLQFLRDIFGPEKPNYIDFLKILLEYFKVVLSTPVLTVGLIYFMVKRFNDEFKSLLLRVTALKFPGVGELSAAQSDRLGIEEKTVGQNPTPEPEKMIPENLSLNSEQQKSLVQFVEAEREKAKIWEFRFLNLLLVFRTQCVLDWIAGAKTTSMGLFETTWMGIISELNERRAIISVLQNHYLIEINGDLLQITQKGTNYLAFRGPLPPPNKK